MPDTKSSTEASPLASVSISAATHEAPFTPASERRVSALRRRSSGVLPAATPHSSCLGPEREKPIFTPGFSLSSFAKSVIFRPSLALSTPGSRSLREFVSTFTYCFTSALPELHELHVLLLLGLLGIVEVGQHHTD